MIQKDYIMRLIQQLAGVLQHVLFHKKAGAFKKAEEELNLASQQLAGLNPELLHALSADAIIKLLQLDEPHNKTKCLILAQIVFELSDIRHLQNQTETSRRLYLKTLGLFMQALKDDSTSPEKEITDKIVIAYEKTKNQSDDHNLKFHLFTFFVKSGHFAKAENILFDLFEISYPNIEKQGEMFYVDLLKRDRDELEAGNLPYEEVIDGQKTWQKLILRRESGK